MAAFVYYSPPQIIYGGRHRLSKILVNRNAGLEGLFAFNPHQIHQIIAILFFQSSMFLFPLVKLAPCHLQLYGKGLHITVNDYFSRYRGRFSVGIQHPTVCSKPIPCLPQVRNSSAHPTSLPNSSRLECRQSSDPSRCRPVHRGTGDERESQGRPAIEICPDLRSQDRSAVHLYLG
jgi:hypothetical protein